MMMSTILDIMRDLRQAFDEVFAKHGCSECGCENYDDSGLFERLKSRSQLTTYADDMIDSGMMGRPLSCQCGHLREKHGALKQRLLTADAVPNGGYVYEAMVRRVDLERRERRAARFAREAGVSVEVVKGGDGVEIEELVIGEGRLIESGDEILVHYVAFVKGSKEAFENTRDGIGDARLYDRDSDGKRPARDGFRMTLGNGTVVPGLDRGLVGTRVGGRRRVSIPSHLAFGSSVVGGQSDADVEFVVDVIAVLSS